MPRARKSTTVIIRHLSPTQTKSKIMKHHRVERLIAGKPIDFRHYERTVANEIKRFREGILKRNPREYLYTHGMVVENGIVGSKGTLDFEVCGKKMFSSYMNAFREHVKDPRVQERLAKVKKIIHINGREIVKKERGKGISMALEERLERIAKARKVDLIYLESTTPKSANWIKAGNWTLLFVSKDAVFTWYHYGKFIEHK